MYWSVTETAKYLGVCPATIRNWVAQGLLRGHQLNPSCKILIKPSDVEAALEKGLIVWRDEDDEE